MKSLQRKDPESPRAEMPDHKEPPGLSEFLSSTLGTDRMSEEEGKRVRVRYLCDRPGPRGVSGQEMAGVQCDSYPGGMGSSQRKMPIHSLGNK